ncbi:MAG: Ig-like domain-containing protein [Anaerolineae bacterium]|nr:Ig-like domain-containing protein [Anaerolineae bacterium]
MLDNRKLTGGRIARVVIVVLLLATIACNMQGCSVPGLPGGPTPRPTIDVASLPPTVPQLVAQRPYPGEELPLDGSIDLYFDQAMDQASVSAALKTDPSLEVALTWVDDSTLRVTPQPGQLARASRYTLTIGSTARSAKGLTLEQAVDVEVETVGFLRVSEVVPAENASGVEPDSVITVLFNRPVVPLGIAEGAPDLPQPLRFSPDIPGTGEWLNTSIYQWTPSQPLGGGQTYAVAMEAGLTDQTGGVLEQPFGWQFTTLPPGITSVAPADGEITIGLDATVQVEFNQQMDRASTEAAFSLVDTSSGQPVAGAFSWDEEGRVMTFTPAGRLALDGFYEAAVAAGARGAGQTPLNQDYRWGFSTVHTPNVASTEPSNGNQSASPYQGISIKFTAPMDQDTLTEDRVLSAPALPETATFYYSDYDWTLHINGMLEPSTDYVVTLLAGASDPYGNTIDQPYTFNFRMAPLDPLVQLNTVGQYGLYDANRATELFAVYRNVSRVDFQLASLSLNEFGSLTGPDGWERLRDFSPSADQFVREWSVPSTAELNVPLYVKVPVASDEGGSLAPGIYLLSADAPEIEGNIRHFMVVVNANLTFKASFDEALVWLTDLESGQPIADVPVTIYGQYLDQMAQGSTDSSGTLEIQTPHQDSLWDRQYVVAQGGGVFALAMTDWSDGVQPWDYSLSGNFNFQDFTLYTYTDRPLYRPGQEVFFKGVLRNKKDVSYSLPAWTSVLVEVFNDQGDVVYTQDLSLDEFGTFNGSLMLDQAAGLGYYSLQVTVGELSGGVGFQVAQYRKPEYIVNVTPKADAVLVGDTIEVEVDTQFYFGGPVSDAEVTWTALSAYYSFDYKGPGRYSFGDYDYDDYQTQPSSDYVPGFGTQIADGEGRTDADGKFIIRLPAERDKSGGSRRFTIEATVTDVKGTSVSGRAEVIVHKGEYYAGVRPDSYVGVAGDKQSASLIVVDWDSRPVAKQNVTVRIVERRWSSVQEEDEFGRTQWTWTVEETPIGQPITEKTDNQGKAGVSFIPPRGGTYKIYAAVTDSKGNETVGSSFMWVTSSEYISWRQPNNNRIDLIADKDTYQPGETAEILIASPFQGSDVKALITVERGSILSHEVITLPSNSYVYKLPITGAHAPNVYVSVVIVKGVDSTNSVPAFRMGLVKLGVDPVQQTIRLELVPDRDVVGPREDVTYTVKTTDYAGKPVDAEVSLALVDLATLALASPNSGPIVDSFYGNQGLGVRTAVPLLYLVDRLNQELFDQGKGGGGGGSEGFFDVRSEFKDTAYWTAVLQTGEDGQAEVTITLPDNLTTWRMDARAVTKETLVGQAEIDIVATRPLLIRPSTPRFLVVNDEVTLSASVNNNTDKDIRATVSLEAAGVTIVGDVSHKVDISVGGRTQVSWPVVVDADVEWVDLVFSVKGGGLEDASKPPLGRPDHDQMLPVYRYEVPETVGTAGQLIDAGGRLEGIVLPPTYDVKQAEVDVQISPSLAAGMTDGLEWLEHYPYECTEQIVSKFLPNALTLAAFRQFNLSDAEMETNLQTQVNLALQKLYAQQHADGGWGWFVSSESRSLVTAYVIQGMVAAGQAGVSVEQRVIDDGIGYLMGNLRAIDTLDRQSDLHLQAYVLYVLAKAGHPDVSRTVQLYEARQGMQHWARALLAQTLWMIDPTDGRIENIKSDLINAAMLSATGAHWEEESNDVWNWNTDTRSTAMILDTFALLWPTGDLGPNITRWLMIAREGGHWETTQETAWALIGLTDWMVATKELDANYDWSFTVNGLDYGSGHAGADTIRQSTVINLTLEDLLKDEVNRLNFSRGDGPGRMYYTAHLTAYLPVEEVKSLSRGVIVSRRYVDADGNPVIEARIGDVLTVQLNIIAPNDLYYVVVEDPYPAGAEAVDISLQTESILGQRPTLRPDAPLARGWGWWWFSQTDLRDEKAVLFADYLPAGTYQYTYQIRLGAVGTFRVIPPVAQEFYLPEVYGRGEGSLFTILPE